MVITTGQEPNPEKARRRRQGDTLRKLRELNDYTVVEFAELVGVTPGAISHWETGRFTPRTRHQVAIARALKVTPSTIFSVDAEVA